MLPKGYSSLNLHLISPNWSSEIPIHNTELYKQTWLNYERQGNERCYFCGYADGEFLEIHHLDHDHSEAGYRHDNLVPCCSICHKVQHLGWVGMKSMGKLIYLPSFESSDDDAIVNYNLELLGLINRFYIMQEFLTEDQRVSLRTHPLTNSINKLINSFQHINIADVYSDRKKLSAEAKERKEKLSRMNKEQKEEFLQQEAQEVQNKVPNDQKSEQEKTANVQDATYLLGDINVMDFVIALSDIDRSFKEGKLTQYKQNPFDKFFDEQSRSVYGKMGIWFNRNVFEPIFPEQNFTLNERMMYYRDTGLFDPNNMKKAIQEIYETHREQPIMVVDTQPSGVTIDNVS